MRRLLSLSLYVYSVYIEEKVNKHLTVLIFSCHFGNRIGLCYTGYYMIRLGNETNTTRSGFTIVELLIVVVVIAILAAITILAYTGIQERTRASAAQSSVSQAGKKIAAYAVTNSNRYPTDLNEIGLSSTDTEKYTYIVNNDITPAHYCISVTNIQSPSLSYAFSSTSGSVLEGVCVRNYALDPNAAGSPAYLKGIGSNQASSTLTIESDRSFTGTTSYRRNVNGTGQAYGGMTANGTIAQDQRVQWSYEVYSTRAGTMNNWGVGQRVSNGNNLGTGGAVGNQTVTLNGWKHMATSMSPSEDVTMDRYGGYNLQVQSGDQVWMDSFMITVTDDEYQFADGSYPGWVWEGSPNASTSFGPTKLYGL